MSSFSKKNYIISQILDKDICPHIILWGLPKKNCAGHRQFLHLVPRKHYLELHMYALTTDVFLLVFGSLGFL